MVRMGPDLGVRRTTIDRASSADMMELASDIGPAPRQVGALLRFGPGTALCVDDVRRSIADRIGGIRRLREQVVPTPWGCGRPVWVEDQDFDIAHHVEAVASRAPGDDTALLATAADLVTRPLPAHRPLWSATLVEGLADGGCALVVIFHHLLADGMGGLAVLASLVDGGMSTAIIEPPAPPPHRSALAYDAASSRLRALAHSYRVPGMVRAALAELRSGSAPRAAQCSINRPVGPRRRFAIVSADLNQFRAVAHAHDASINDVMLVAVGGALDKLLAHRREHVDPFVISVPVSGRSQGSAGALGNQVGVMPVAVPASGEATTRLEAVAAATRAHKARIRGASAALLVPAFRALGTLHVLRWGVNHQHFSPQFRDEPARSRQPGVVPGRNREHHRSPQPARWQCRGRVRRHVLFRVSHSHPHCGSRCDTGYRCACEWPPTRAGPDTARSGASTSRTLLFPELTHEACNHRSRSGHQPIAG